MSASQPFSFSHSTPLFTLGRCEVTPAAQAALDGNSVPALSLFRRHERGDWGDAPEWLGPFNDRAARQGPSDHVIESRYRLDGGPEVRLMTASDRTRTLLLLDSEFQDREVDARTGYAAWATSYDAVPNPLITIEQPVVDALLAGLPPGGTAADVGTGTGRLALGLARRGWAVTGYDSSPEMLHVARQAAGAGGLGRIEFIQASLDEGLPAEDGRFDLLTCALVLCHVPDIRAAVRECARLVHPGGHLLLTDFHPAAIGWGWRTAFMEPGARYRLPNPGHSRDDYLKAVADAGCAVLDVQDIALDGQAYGDVSAEAVQQRGEPPLCLTLLARRNPSDGKANTGIIMGKDAK